MSTTDRADTAPDVYFLPEYGRAASIAESGDYVNIEAHGGDWRMPLIVRTLADGSRDAITPTFSGIYTSASLSTHQILESWATTVARLRELDIISVVVRGSPVERLEAPLPGLLTISSGRPTVVLDLSDDVTAWQGMRSSSRSRIRKAEKNGYVGEIRPAELSDVMPGGAFRNLYEVTMERIGADPLYHFGDDYYSALLDGLGSNLLVAEVHDPGGGVVSACLLMRHEGRLHYHLAGSEPHDARMGSNNLMMWSGIRFAIEQGLRHFHIGAGVAGRPGVYRFKTTFGGHEAPYDVLGMVIDDDGYHRQVRVRAAELAMTADELLKVGFFPAYRANRGGSP